MTAIDFITNLESRYPAMSVAVGDDIKGAIMRLNSDQLKTLWQAFLDSYDFNAPPRRATFTKLMAKEGFYQKEQENRMYVGLCRNCNVSFPNHTKGCPLCGGNFVLADSNSITAEFIKVHPHCDICQRFVPHETVGAMCEYWGKAQSEWGLRGDAYKRQVEVCKRCECHICCREERIFRTSYDLYKDMSAKGKFVDGYIQKKP